MTNSVFFTKNGQLMGNACTLPNRPTRFYAAVSSGVNGDIFRANFGLSGQPFRFDLEQYLSDNIKAERDEIHAMALRHDVVNELVSKYLLHKGYHGTYSRLQTAMCRKDQSSAEPMDAYSGGGGGCLKDLSWSSISPDLIIASSGERILERKRIADFILTGDIANAILHIESEEPQLLSCHRLGVAGLYLHSQNVVELLRRNKAVEALEYLKENLARYNIRHVDSDSSPYQAKIDQVLADICALFVYHDDNPMGAIPYMFSVERRHEVVRTVNEALCSCQGLPRWDPIELVLRQTMTVQNFVRECRGDRGPQPSAFSVLHEPILSERTMPHKVDRPVQ